MKLSETDTSAFISHLRNVYFSGDQFLVPKVCNVPDRMYFEQDWNFSFPCTNIIAMSHRVLQGYKLVRLYKGKLEGVFRIGDELYSYDCVRVRGFVGTRYKLASL